MALWSMPLFIFASWVIATASAVISPETIAAFQAIQQPAPPPGTNLNASLEPIKMRVPNSDITLTFRNYGQLLYQTDVSLCLLEGVSDLFTLAVKAKGDGYIATDKFSKHYGGADVDMHAYSPPTQRLKTSQAVQVLRGIGFFMSLYGYFQVDIEIFSGRDGHVGIAWVGDGSLESIA